MVHALRRLFSEAGASNFVDGRRGVTSIYLINNMYKSNINTTIPASLMHLKSYRSKNNIATYTF